MVLHEPSAAKISIWKRIFSIFRRNHIQLVIQYISLYVPVCPCISPMWLLLSGNQTWLAGKSTIWFDMFPAIKLDLVHGDFPAKPCWITGGQTSWFSLVWYPFLLLFLGSTARCKSCSKLSAQRAPRLEPWQVGCRTGGVSSTFSLQNGMMLTPKPNG